jgi:formylglycine-generating enzyme required for sulfatase activity
MTWYAARLYCARKGKRLPTENEWEAAARGRQDRRFPWGDALPRCAQVQIADGGWIPGRADCVVPEASVPVGTMVQDVTQEGVHDLGGNVSEWTASWFVEGNRAAQPATAPEDAMRVIRGGSWNSSLMARTSGRDGLSPSVVGPNIGFRCASNLEDAAP